jgi:hypothetical protein
MKTCPHCNKENPSDFEHCRYCGNDLQFTLEDKPKIFWKKIPSWVWVIIIPACIAGILALFIGTFFAITTIEGFASIILLAAGIIGFVLLPLRNPYKPNAFVRAIGITFFAFMGAAIDQTGNIIYNKPVEMCFCNTGSRLARNEDISNPLPGTTYVEQDFTCINNAGEPVKQINTFAVIGIRFLEYVLLAYLLIGLRHIIWKMKNGGFS